MKTDFPSIPGGAPERRDALLRLTQRGCFRLVLLASLALASAGCRRHPAETDAKSAPLPTATVRVQTVERKTHQAMEEVLGTVRAKLRANIEANASGRIVQMPVVAGQAVKQHDLIALLDMREIQARLEQARAAREQADRDRQRFRALLEQKALTQAEYDAVETRLRIAEASVQEAETMLGYAKVTAPFDGVVSRKLADVGDLASPGRSLVELEDPRFLRLEMDVPEGLITKIRAGQQIGVRVSTLTETLQGTVSEIAPAADPQSRTFRVKLDLPPTPNLRLGLFARAAVPVGETSLPRVPVGALVKRGQLEMVFAAAGDRADMRLVKSGEQIGNEIEILSGVEPGEKVVVEGADGLVDGQPLAIRP